MRPGPRRDPCADTSGDHVWKLTAVWARGPAAARLVALPETKHRQIKRVLDGYDALLRNKP
jgi:hypothetical protein